MREWRYWQMPAGTDAAPDEAQWVERVRAQLDTSVRMQMVSDVPIGAFLSGGIDSSTVLAFMARHSTEPVKTYSIGFDAAGSDRWDAVDYRRPLALVLGGLLAVQVALGLGTCVMTAIGRASANVVTARVVPAFAASIVEYANLGVET